MIKRLTVKNHNCTDVRKFTIEYKSILTRVWGRNVDRIHYILAGFYESKTIAITGAGGSVGQLLIRRLLQLNIRRLIAIDIDPTALRALSIQTAADPRVQTVLLDITEAPKLAELFTGTEIVFHAAAQKHICIAEEDPIGTLRINAFGLANVRDAAYTAGVDRLIFTSSDKAVAPTGTMGASKLIGERILSGIPAETAYQNQGTRTVSLRFGNIGGSSGSVIPRFHEAIKLGVPIPLTDPNMTRFVMTPQQASDLVLNSAILAQGGEILIAKMPSLRIQDLAVEMSRMLAPHYGWDPANYPIEVKGIRAGEKLKEELTSEAENHRLMSNDRFLCILPEAPERQKHLRDCYANKGFETITRIYSSESEPPMTPQQIREFLLQKDVLPESVQQACAQTRVVTDTHTARQTEVAL